MIKEVAKKTRQPKQGIFPLFYPFLENPHLSKPLIF